jgi:hypothetical protein
MAKLSTIFPGTPIVGRLWYITHDLILTHDAKPLNMEASNS